MRVEHADEERDDAFDFASDYDDEPCWDADPATILEQRELSEGVNCFGHTIY